MFSIIKEGIGVTSKVLEVEARNKGLSFFDCDLVWGFWGESKDIKSSSMEAFEICSVPNANDIGQDDTMDKASRHT